MRRVEQEGLPVGGAAGEPLLAAGVLQLDTKMRK